MNMMIKKQLFTFVLLVQFYGFSQFLPDKAFYLDLSEDTTGWKNYQVAPVTLDFTPEGEMMVGAYGFMKRNSKGEENVKEHLAYYLFDKKGKFKKGFYTGKYGNFMPYASHYDKERKKYIQMIHRPNPSEWDYTSVNIGLLQLENDLSVFSFMTDEIKDIGYYTTPYIAKLDKNIFLSVNYASPADEYSATRIDLQLFEFDNGGTKQLKDVYIPELKSGEDQSFTHLDYRNNALQIGNRFYLYSFYNTPVSNVDRTGLYFETKVIHEFYLNDTKDSLIVKSHAFDNRGYEAISNQMIYDEPFLLASIESGELVFIAQNREKYAMVDIWKFKFGQARPTMYKPQIFRNLDIPMAKFRHVKRIPGKGYLLYAFHSYDKEINCLFIDENFNFVKQYVQDVPKDFYVDNDGLNTKIIGSSDIKDGEFKIAISTLDVEGPRTLKVWVIPCKF